MSIFILLIPLPPDERPDDLVGADYVARRFGCSERSVYRGACGTSGITPVSRDPWRAVRAQVEAEHQKLVRSEERRVGKGWRARWPPCQSKKTQRRPEL